MSMGWKISCRQATDWISRSDELPLTRRQRILIRLHNRRCILCRRFQEQHAWLAKALKAWPLHAGTQLQLSEEQLKQWELKFENNRQ